MRLAISVAALVLVVVTLMLFVRWLEPRIAFFPSVGEDDTPDDYGASYAPLAVRTVDGEELRGWHLQPGDGGPARALIVYFHGNAGNLSMWAPVLADMAARGYAVIAFDYRGYGLSTGRPTEQGLYRDADAVVAYIAALPGPAAPIVYWGRSLGTAVAAYAASRRRPAGIVLESGFSDARSALRASPLLAVLARLSTYGFGTAEFLRRVDPPVPALLLHGDRDTVVPYAEGRLLFDRITGPKELVTIPGGRHNDSRPADERTYWEAVDRFVSRL